MMAISDLIETLSTETRKEPRAFSITSITAKTDSPTDLEITSSPAGKNYTRRGFLMVHSLRFNPWSGNQGTQILHATTKSSHATASTQHSQIKYIKKYNFFFKKPHETR